ncbi:Transmembrane [Brachionus plicatilis]|uniref:Transmembrane n=1 Tax=Brachionus plicatilis TaxID=10195 RepID=A0A3M7SFJ6_BRAPC|nr:Transmembrane [Brachionus plicatilis]
MSIFKMLFGVNRNCWFCNQYTKVSFFNQNSWTCAQCSQYNGFDKNGDYNREIPEMYQQSKKKTFLSNKTKFLGEKNSFLCGQCTSNQKIKIEKLSNFQPQREETFDLEIQLYKEYMEKIYDLCDKCKSKVKFEITRQDGILKQYLYKIGKFDYLFERNILGKRLTTFRNQTISHNSNLVSIAKIFLHLFTLILSTVTILYNDYSNSDLIKNLFYFSPSLDNQVREFISKISSLTNNSTSIKLNNQIPLLVCINHILLCTSLMVENEHFKAIVSLLSLNTFLIVSNYGTIYKNLNLPQNFPICLKFVPVCTGLMILIIIFKLINIKFKCLNLSERPEMSSQGSIIPNLKNKSNQENKIIKPARFKPVSKSLLDFKPARASVDSSDLSPSSSRSLDDDSSSIVSGLTNLYLDRSRNMDQSIKKDFGLVHCVESNYSSFYQCKNGLRNRSIASYKWLHPFAQPSQISKKEIFVVY